MSAKRFATWFFVGEVTGGEEVADGIETDRLHWFRPADAFAARTRARSSSRRRST